VNKVVSICYVFYLYNVFVICNNHDRVCPIMPLLTWVGIGLIGYVPNTLYIKVLNLHTISKCLIMRLGHFTYLFQTFMFINRMGKILSCYPKFNASEQRNLARGEAGSTDCWPRSRRVLILSIADRFCHIKY
jgi:hypothetical protein